MAPFGLTLAAPLPGRGPDPAAPPRPRRWAPPSLAEGLSPHSMRHSFATQFGRRRQPARPAGRHGPTPPHVLRGVATAAAVTWIARRATCSPGTSPARAELPGTFSAEEPLASATVSSWESIRSPRSPPRRRLLAYARFFATQRSPADPGISPTPVLLPSSGPSSPARSDRTTNGASSPSRPHLREPGPACRYVLGDSFRFTPGGSHRRAPRPAGTPARGVAKRQAAVLYHDDAVLGSGTISGTSSCWPSAMLVRHPAEGKMAGDLRLSVGADDRAIIKRAGGRPLRR